MASEIRTFALPLQLQFCDYQIFIYLSARVTSVGSDRRYRENLTPVHEVVTSPAEIALHNLTNPVNRGDWRRD